MKGTYRFYQQGRLVGESENLITDAGKRHILRYLAGEEGRLAGSIAVGAGTSEPIGTDTRLTYEFDRSTIYLVSPSYIDKRIIFKSTLSREIVGSIYEIGLYSTTFGSFSTGHPSTPLASFESGVETWSNGTFVSGNQRMGPNALRISAAANGTATSSLPSVVLDLSGYANSDVITIAFYCVDAHTSSIRFRLRGQNPADYYELAVPNPIEGYNVLSFPKSSLTKVGVPNFSIVDSLEVSVSAKITGAAVVDFDGVRIEAFSPDIENILISRSVLPTPILKTDTSDMDIEYSLEVQL